MRHLRAYAQLVRLPNLFTALADICLGAIVTQALPDHWLPFGCLLLASACLYSGGMVWNDFFDLEQDRRERPLRPLPSGRITTRAAAWFGGALLAAGFAFAVLAVWVGAVASETPTRQTSAIALVLAGILVAAILLYDAWLKRTWAGPIGMGVCRFLNVLMGLSVAGSLHWSRDLHLAFVVGIYVVGVTWFARTEARASKRTALTTAGIVMFGSLLLALPVPPLHGSATTGSWLLYLLVGLGFLVGIPVWQAIAAPMPARVQTAVKRAVLGLVVLDAALATGLAGIVGLLILLLLLPALFLGRWIYST